MANVFDSQRTSGNAIFDNQVYVVIGITINAAIVNPVPIISASITNSFADVSVSAALLLSSPVFSSDVSISPAGVAVSVGLQMIAPIISAGISIAASDITVSTALTLLKPVFYASIDTGTPVFDLTKFEKYRAIGRIRDYTAG